MLVLLRVYSTTPKSGICTMVYVAGFLQFAHRNDYKISLTKNRLFTNQYPVESLEKDFINNFKTQNLS
jgi:hypothetical protein